MRASTAFLVGVGTVGLAIIGGLGGGLVIADMMSPSPPKHDAQTARLERQTPPQPMPASAPLHYVAGALAFSDPSIDGSTPASAEKQADNTATSSPPPSVAAAVPGDHAAKPADDAAARQPALERRQAPSAKQASMPEDAYANARDADLKHEAYKHRAEQPQRWAHHRDQNQNADQQARDDRNGEGGDQPSYYFHNRSDQRFRDDRSDRYRDARRDDDDDAPRYYVDRTPRFGFPPMRLFGPDD